MQKVITYGTFDLLHYGHIELLRKARQLGDVLIVGLSTDEFNKVEKNKISAQSFAQRKANLEAIRFVDQIIPEENWEQKRNDIIKYQVRIFTIGEDWEGKFDFLKSLCQVVYLPRTPDISSTILRQVRVKNVRE